MTMCPKCGMADSPTHRRGVLHRRNAKIRALIAEGQNGAEIATALGITRQRAHTILRHIRQTIPLEQSNQTKLSILLGHMASQRWDEALKLAAKFQHLGEHRREITRGADALKHPEFYRQLRKDPAALIAEGIAALKERYGNRT